MYKSCPTQSEKVDLKCTIISSSTTWVLQKKPSGFIRWFQSLVFIFIQMSDCTEHPITYKIHNNDSWEPLLRSFQLAWVSFMDV